MEEMLFCAQKVMDELLNSSSSDEDDELFAVLNVNLQKPKNLTKDKPNSRSAAENEQENYENEVIDLLSTRNIQSLEDDDEIAIVISENDEEVESPLKSVISSISEYDYKRNVHISREDAVFGADKQTTTVLANSNEQLQENPFEDNVMHSLSETDFKRNYHIKQESAMYLMDKYSLWSCNGSFRESSKKATVTTTILSFLWFCSNAISFGDVALQLNTSLANITQSFDNVLKFFMEELASEVIKLPSSYPEKEAVAKEFEKVSGFPNVLGCIDESYFPMKSEKLAQKCGGSEVCVRGICDSKRRFSNVKIGLPKEFTNDSFLEKVLPKLCFPKYHLVGNSKCPILGHLMIPFDNNGNLSDSENHFNIKLYRTHVKIKNAFGILRSRFQQLKYLGFDNYEIMSKFVYSCCILHNICIDREDFYNDEIYSDVSEHRHSSSFASIKNDDMLTDLGVMKRFELKEILYKAKR